MFGSLRGSIWKEFGKVLGASWAILGSIWAPWELTRTSFFTIGTRDVLQNAPRWPQDWILGGFGEGLGRLWHSNLKGLGLLLDVCEGHNAT